MILSALEMENEGIISEIVKGYNKILDLIESTREFEIVKVRYVASNVVEVTVKVKKPDTFTVLEKLYDYDFESPIIVKIGMLEQKKLSEEDLKKEIVKILFNNKKQLKDVTEVEVSNKMIELMMNELTVNVEKLLKEKENIYEYEDSFYLEKNGDKWEIPELEEKIKRFQEINF